MRALGPWTAGEYAGFAEHHHVARIVAGRPDQIDDRESLDPFAHRLRAGPRLAGAAAGEDQPIDPVARRRQLIGPRPEAPVEQQIAAPGLIERMQKFALLAGRQSQHFAKCPRPWTAPVPGIDRRCRVARFVGHGFVWAEWRLSSACRIFLNRRRFSLASSTTSGSDREEKP